MPGGFGYSGEMRKVLAILITAGVTVLASGCGTPCSDPTPADCGGGVCCPEGENWYCANTGLCYDSVANAEYDCSNSYQTCK